MISNKTIKQDLIILFLTLLNCSKKILPANEHYAKVQNIYLYITYNFK